MAIEFGNHLKDIIPRACDIYHSPFVRCKQTAEAILHGMKDGNHEAMIRGILNELIDVHGDMSKIMAYQEMLDYDWVNYWLLGFFPEDDIEPAIHYGWRVCNKALHLPGLDHAPLVILVGHDDLLLAIRAVTAGIPVDKSWLSYLGGFWLQFAADAIIFSDANHSSRKSPYPFWWGQE